jgi:hypothetical protein
VIPGGGLRGNRNPFGGNSPFYILMKPSSAGLVEFEELVNTIRAASFESRQEDLRQVTGYSSLLQPPQATRPRPRPRPRSGSGSGSGSGPRN